MAITVTHGQSISGGGVTIQPQPIKHTGSGAIGLEETLSAAEAGSLTTRTSDTAGEITMDDAGHTIETADTVDVFWDGGVAYGCTVGTVSGTAVPISSASGDVLPSTSTAVTVVAQASANIAIDGDEAKLLAIIMETNDPSLRTAGHIQFQDSGAAEIAELDLVANVPQVWNIKGGASNPFTGNPITVAKLSNGGSDSSETYTLKIVGVQDATP